MDRLENLCVYTGVLAAGAVVAWLYELSLLLAAGFCICACCAVNRIRKYMREDQIQEDIYHQVAAYLEQLLCSYRRLEHAGKALEDCRVIFQNDSRMGGALADAAHILRTGEGVPDGRILEAAFVKIERAFDSRRLGIVHRFICNAERTGGDTGRGADILLEDLELWKNRTKLYQSKKRFIKIECGVATLLSMFLCYVSKLLTPKELGFRISDGMMYQISTIVVLVLLLYIVSCIFKKLSGNWLDEKEKVNEKQQKKYLKLYQILEKGDSVTGITKHMAKRILGRYVREEFPYWLLLVTLYLQTESSYQAFRYSMCETTGIFRSELQRLTEEIYDSPRDLQPYLNFFAVLNIPEIKTGMKILYSVNSNGYEESGKQLGFLISQNSRLMDKNEVFRHGNKMAGMSMLKQLPMLISCLKLLLDLIQLLAMTMGSFQNMDIA